MKSSQSVFNQDLDPGALARLRTTWRETRHAVMFGDREMGDKGEREDKGGIGGREDEGGSNPY